MYKVIGIIIAFITLCSLVEGLSDVGTATYSSRITRRCRFPILSADKEGVDNVSRQAAPTKPVPAPCCHGRCAVQYNMSGRWSTSLDRVATASACHRPCFRHFYKCYGKCRCMAFLSAIRSGRFCKCVRSISSDGLIRKCRNSCKSAYISCTRGCTTNRCPLTATTNVRFSINSSGKCASVCRSRCPAVSGLRDAEDEDITPIPANIDPLAYSA